MSSIRDITDQLRADAALRAEMEFSRTLVQSSPAFFVAIRPNGVVRMMNKAMLASTGWTEEEALGMPYLDNFVPVPARGEVAEVFRQIGETGQVSVVKNPVQTRSGEVLLVEWRGVPVIKEGRLDYFFGVGVDVTERERTEEKLRASEESYRSIFENALEGMFQSTPAGRFTRANPSFARMCGYNSAEELIEAIGLV